MKALRNCWYMATWSERLGEGDLLGTQLLGERVVLFRSGGVVSALVDICPHKLVPLSKGKLCDGNLRCGYHGLEFDRHGQCIRNPHGSQKIPAAAKVKTYPIYERHSIVWIWMGKPELADPSEIPDFSMLDETAEVPILSRGYLKIRANYELVVENLLDLSHSLYLHDGTLGNEEMARASITVEQVGDQVQVRRFVADVTPPIVFDLNYMRDGKPVDLWADSRWDKPACLLLDTGVAYTGRPREESSGFAGTHFLTPIDERNTHYFFAAVRTNMRSWGEPTDTELQKEIAATQRTIFAEQDEKMLEAQQQIRDELALEHPAVLMLDIDAGVKRYRSILHRLQREERTAAP